MSAVEFKYGAGKRLVEPSRMSRTCGVCPAPPALVSILVGRVHGSAEEHGLGRPDLRLSAGLKHRSASWRMSRVQAVFRHAPVREPKRRRSEGSELWRARRQIKACGA